MVPEVRMREWHWTQKHLPFTFGTYACTSSLDARLAREDPEDLLRIHFHIHSLKYYLSHPSFDL
jgi:hypothetical protein